MKSDDPHFKSDVDSSWFAKHHTLGPKKNQASPGDHTHDGINSKLIGGDWTDWDPQFRTGFSGYDLGDGTEFGHYLTFGPFTFFEFYIVFGTTTTFGGGSLYIQAPTDMDYLPGYGQVVAHGTYYDRTTFDHYGGVAGVATTNKNILLYSTSGEMTSTSPITFTNMDRIYLSGWYKNAS